KDLSEFDVILLAESGVTNLQKADVERLEKFMDEGGRVVVSASYFFRGSVPKANELLVPHGLQMTDADPDVLPVHQFFELKGADSAEDPLTKDVKQVRVHRPSPTAVTDKAKGKILVAAPHFPPGEGFIASARAGKGEIVALGASLWWHWIS